MLTCKRLSVFLIIIATSLTTHAQSDRQILFESDVMVTLDLDGSKPGEATSRADRVLYRASEEAAITGEGSGQMTLVNFIVPALLEGSLPAYYDGSLERQIAGEDLNRLLGGGTDTIEQIDENFDVTYTIVDAKPDLIAVEEITTHQNIRFSEAGGLTQQTTVGSIQATNLINGERIYFPVIAESKTIDLNATCWTMVERVKIDLPTTELGSRSDDRNLDDLMRFVEVLKPDGNSLDGYRDATDWRSIPDDVVQSWPAGVDTVEQLNEALERSIFTVERSQLSERVSSMRLHQLWGWDSCQNRLVTSSIGYSPIAEIYDDAGALLYNITEFHYINDTYRDRLPTRGK